MTDNSFICANCGGRFPITEPIPDAVEKANLGPDDEAVVVCDACYAKIVASEPKGGG